jgi:cellulose biosynthesis protein BcsQ
MRIGFATPKGGSGKSTLSFLVTLAFGDIGKPARLVDHDPQRHSHGWASRAGVAVGEGAGDVTVCDFPPTPPDSLAAVVAAARLDLLVCPCQPFSPEAQSVKALVAVLPSELKQKARLVFTMLDNTTLSRPEMRKELEQLAGIPALRTGITRRNCYRVATLHEGWRSLDAAAKAEVHKLIAELAMT